MPTLYIVIYFILYIFGIVGNTICFLIYSHQKLNKISVSFFFKAISINNCFILLQQILRLTDPAFSYDMELLSVFSCKLVKYVDFSTASINSWIMVYVLMDRLISIKFNRKFLIFYNLKFKCLILISIYLSCHCIYIPLAIDLKISSYNTDINQTDLSLKCQFDYKKELITIIDLIYSTTMPFILMAIFTSFSIHLILKSRKRFKNKIGVKDRIRKDVNFALTSIILNLIFLAAYLPQTLLPLLFEISEFDLVNNLLYVNCAVSICIHSFSNKIFRQELVALLSFNVKIGPIISKSGNNIIT